MKKEVNCSRVIALSCMSLFAGIPLWLLVANEIGFDSAARTLFPSMLIVLGINNLIEGVKLYLLHKRS